MNGATGTAFTPGAPLRPVRRVRHEVRDGLTVMAFSLAVSCALAVVLLVLTRLGR